MGLPRKPQITHDVNPPKIGKDYMKYGIKRIKKLIKKTDENTKHLPRTITPEDLDWGIFDYVNSEKLEVILNNKKTPVFYMETHRWGEFAKTWQYMDGDKNVPTPYIIVRRVNKEPGTRMGDPKYRVPQPHKFIYTDVPILDEGQEINLRFKIPQPVNIDLTFDVNLFTKYRVDVNEFDRKVLKNFASRQDYVWVKGTPLPLIFEGMEETNTVQNVEGDKLYISKYTIKLLGLLQNEDEFEIVKTSRKPRIGWSVK